MSKKKYPKDAFVTLEMLKKIFSPHLYPSPNEKIESMIEPPGPEPKEGEWWMCRYKNDEVDTIAVLVVKDGQWRLTSTVKTSWFQEFITPLHKMVPSEEDAE